MLKSLLCSLMGPQSPVGLDMMHFSLHFSVFKHEVNEKTQDAHKRLVLQVYLGLNTLDFLSAIHR